MTSPIKVFVLSESPFEGDCITSVLSSKTGITVSGSASVCPLPLDEITAAKPKVVVMSVTMLSKETTDFLRQRYAFGVVVIVPNLNRAWALQAMQAGAKGCLSNRDGSDVLVEAIECLVAGKTFMVPEVRSALLAKICPIEYAADGVDSLSCRELEIYTLLGRGMPNRTIATHLDLSIKTGQAYGNRIKTKLDLSNGFDLVRSAMVWDSSTGAV